mmetsp:Transcript_74665/g.172959  ORF Transcript_74665/g.172959 Transcript_74665/m.172959 type:complete len:256 (-) Transcript_74665:45-812(-)
MCCGHYARKVVVQQDDVGCILGNLGAGDAHGKAHISRLQRWRIVGTVAGHGYHLPVGEDGDLLLLLQALAFGSVFEEATVVQALGQGQLVLRRGPGKHAQVGPDLVKLLLAEERLTFSIVNVHELAELLTFHGPLWQDLASGTVGVLRAKDLGLLGNGYGGRKVVASDHPHVDACRVAARDGPHNLWTQWVLDAHNSNQGELCLATKRRCAVRVCHVLVQLFTRKVVDVFVSQTYGSHGTVRERLDDPLVQPLLV